MEGAMAMPLRTETEERRRLVGFGMFVFIASEAMFFAGFYVMYIVFRFAHPEMVHTRQLSTGLGSLNTLLLAASGLAMALAVKAARTGDQARLKRWLLAAPLLACGFLVVKGLEYAHKFQDGLFPGTDLFYGCYFLLTAFHGLHVVAGLLAMAILWVRAWRGHFNAGYYSPVASLGMYWYFVDSVWLLLFVTLYLV